MTSTKYSIPLHLIKFWILIKMAMQMTNNKFLMSNQIPMQKFINLTFGNWEFIRNWKFEFRNSEE